MTSQEDCGPPPQRPDDQRRGLRHLRVGIELSEGESRITRMWLVDQPAIQHDPLVRQWIARVDLGPHSALLESFDDPRELRGEYRKGSGHSFGRSVSGVLYVSIPFVQIADLVRARVRLARREDLGTKAFDVATLDAAFDGAGRPPLVDLSAADLQRHPDWGRVAKALGLTVVEGRFEIYVDCDGAFRWRIVGPGDRVVAESAQGHAKRPECERELQWVRANARGLPVKSLDVGPRRGSSKTSP